MKSLYFLSTVIFIIVIVFSCSKPSNDTGISDEERISWKIDQQAMQKSKDIFYASDSANEVINRIVWADDVQPVFVFGEGGMVFRSANSNMKETTSMYLPCLECSWDDIGFSSSLVYTEHKRLDSAIVNAKVRGVDGIFYESPKYIEAHGTNDTINHWVVDSVDYHGYYGDYMSRAQFACLYIKKEKRKYKVFAAIRVRNESFSQENAGDLEDVVSEWDMDAFRKYAVEKAKELKKFDKLNDTENVESPSE